MRKKWQLILALIIASLIGLFFYNSSFAKTSYKGFYSVSCQEKGKKMARDYAFKINIIVDGKKYNLPKNFGKTSCLNEIYSDKTNGIVFVRTNEFKSFTLGNFFNQLNEDFDKERIFDKRVSGNHKLEVYVNGVKVNTYENTPLFPDSNIEIVYK
jgi:hypothetical protein